MSHDTHHRHSHENKTIISFKNSFWLIIILVGLFVAALNFVQAESAGEEGAGHEGARTEANHEMGKEGAATEKSESPNGTKAKAEQTPRTFADSTVHKEGK